MTKYLLDIPETTGLPEISIKFSQHTADQPGNFDSMIACLFNYLHSKENGLEFYKKDDCTYTITCTKPKVAGPLLNTIVAILLTNNMNTEVDQLQTARQLDAIHLTIG